MTWEQLDSLPEEIAGEIELWNGRVVWAPRGPSEHQVFSGRVFAAFERCVAAQWAVDIPQVGLETNVFFGRTGRDDYATPNFLVYRRSDELYQDIRADDVLPVGEIVSPYNIDRDMHARRARYAAADISWYWEVRLARGASAIELVRVYALETRADSLPSGVQPEDSADYVLVGEWTPAGNEDGIHINRPFPISIPWSDLEY
ncbi:hypothetical protein NRB56_07190 [Nocardia sp. RB56]|uniref:Putative restriction endonuclease domain-containing protein n=2 Tax=Nocardia aurantia TaxID=2585199 RepID=A0A7K0DH74_9NOCA|nr:hypothetical protein [Nocardia aurantia]